MNNIHPKDKLDVGRRLANWALANQYGFKSIVYSGPIYKSMQIDKGKIKIHFLFANEGLAKKEETLGSFFIAGADRHFKRAKAKIVEKNTIEVYNCTIKHPVAVRFGFANAPHSNLFNKSGLPASPFRTDNWTIKRLRK